MGCDIHSSVEVNYAASGAEPDWRIFEAPIFHKKRDPLYYGYDAEYEPFHGRDYRLFGLLAGVRCWDVEPLVDPRGLPDDVSSVTRINADDNYSHSHSWLTLAELQTVDLDAVVPDPDFDRTWRETELGDTITVLSGLGSPDRVRVVFWFDS